MRIFTRRRWKSLAVDYQLTTSSDFCFRCSVFIVGTLFYIACDKCARVMQNQQNLRYNVCLYCHVVVLRPGRPEVRILPVAPENLIAMFFCNEVFLFWFFQNNFSNISSVASVYCPCSIFLFRSWFTAFLARQTSSLVKTAFLPTGRESTLSIKYPVSRQPVFMALCR